MQRTEAPVVHRGITVGSQKEQASEGFLRIRIADDARTEVNGRTFDKVVVHIGDGTMLAALGSLADANTAVIVIDPHADFGASIIDELYSGPVVFFTLETNRDLQEEYSALMAPRSPAITDAMDGAYRDRWQKAKPNIDNLFLVKAPIETISVPRDSVDEISYYFPDSTQSSQSVYQFAIQTLRQNGFLRVVSEEQDVIRAFAMWPLPDGFEVTTTSFRPNSQPVYSLYSELISAWQHYQATIRRIR